MGFFDRFKNSSKPKKFKYLDKLIHSGVKEIILDSDIVLGGLEGKKYLKGIKLDVDELIIDGNGFTVDARGKTRIFYCTGKNITIKNISLKNGFAKEGGAIYSVGELNINNCLFDSNVIYMHESNKGASIYNNGGKCSITDSIFTRNASHNGGAIYNNGGKCSITASTLNNNTWGEVIYNNSGECNIHASIFKNNSGGRPIYNDGGECSITDSLFKNNSRSIHNTSGGVCSITDSKFEGNKGVCDSGVIYNEEGECSITDSTFDGNTVDDKTGVIHNKGELKIHGSTFTGNTANRNGGVIYNQRGNFKIFDCEILKNKTTSDIISNYDSLQIHNTIFRCNVSSFIVSNNGGRWSSNKGGECSIADSILKHNKSGVIYNQRGNFKIFNCEILKNKTTPDIISNYDSLQIHNTIFRCNKSKFIVSNKGDESNLGIFNGEFKENNIEKSILCNDGKFCSIENTVFQNNISNNKLNIINNSELTLTNPEIKDKGKSILNHNYVLIRKLPLELENIIYGEGTVETIEDRIPQGENFDFGYLDKKIHENNSKELVLDHDITLEDYERDFYEGGIDLDINNLIIDGNGKTINGADKSRIFIITGKNITLKNIIFKNGLSHKNYDIPLNNNGGAIKINHATNITIENCEFINNTSAEYGGAICNNNGECSITDSTLDNNAAYKGGAVYNNNDSVCNIFDSIFEGNIGEYNSGAIENHGECIIIDSKFRSNTAEYEGGAVYNTEGAKCNVINSIFKNNSQSIHNAHGGLCSIADSTFDGNQRAIKNGGRCTIIRSKVVNNTGGAVSNISGDCSITDSTFEGNTKDKRGGAIYNNGAICSIDDSTFDGNAAKSGGAIYNEKGECSITHSKLLNNISKGKAIVASGTFYNHGGGAIYNYNAICNIDDSTFDGNAAKSYGGVIYNIEGAECSITDSTFVGNTADNGGAICNNKAKCSITDSTFVGNTADNGGAIFLLFESKNYESSNCTFNDNEPNDVGKY